MNGYVPFDDEPDPWSALADALDAAPGGEHLGLTQKERALIARLGEDPSVEAWVSARTIHITPRDTVWLAMMQHTGMLFHQRPSFDQLVKGLSAAVRVTRA